MKSNCAVFFMCLLLCATVESIAAEPLQLSWEKNWLTVAGDQIPGQEIRIHYLEAYCRAGSTDADWVQHTRMEHETELVSADESGTKLHLRCHVNDGLIVDHLISSTEDEVQFELTARNPTETRSAAIWAQPCVRLADFTGKDQETYLAKSFIFLDGELTRMPTRNWATTARYIPGQVWAPTGIDRNDVNPRPLSDLVPSNGLIGCFSADETKIFATAWEPYQELFQGVAVCLHSDFRLGGLQPGEAKQIRGRIYIVESDVDALLRRYSNDFPEQTR